MAELASNSANLAAVRTAVQRPNHPFDGVRAILVLLVMGGHLEIVPGLAGGQSRAIAFFALSGFLITTVLLKRFDRTDRIDPFAFWVARAARFAPTLLVLTAVAVVAALAKRFDWWSSEALPVRELLSELPTLWSQTTNIAMMNQDPLPWEFVPSWSLAIEWQFYLIWPVVMLLVLSLATRRALGWLALALAVSGFGWSIWLAVTLGPEEPRVAFGSDTRAAGIALGCAAAVAATSPGLRLWAARNARPIVVLSAAVLVLMFFDLFFESAPTMTTWGQIAVAVPVCAAAVALWVQPASSAALVAPPLVWLGQRSLGIFLLHVPVMQLLGGKGDYQRSATIIVVTIALSALTRSFLSNPFSTWSATRLRRLTA